MPVHAPNKRSRAWCFTWNNYSDADVVYVRSLAAEADYLVFGRERGASGTPHLQGYITFRNARTFASVRTIFKNNHVESAMKDDAAALYCKKEGDFEEFGERPKGQGKRCDLDEVRDRLAAGAAMHEIVQEARSFQSIKAAEAVLKWSKPVPRENVEVMWIVGESGSGKSTLASNMMGWRSVFWKPAGKWWDGYTNERSVIWDDFRDTAYPADELFRALQPLPCRCEIKGGSVQLSANRFIVTSIKYPWECYPSEPQKQLLRRIQELVIISDDGAELAYARAKVDSICVGVQKPNVTVLKKIAG